MYHKSNPKTIQSLFSHIAPHYDRANAILSLGLHGVWNQTLVNALSLATQGHMLDLCAGTGEIAFRFLKKHPEAYATLLDFCPEMLMVAEKKGMSLEGRFSTLVGDAQEIPLPDRTVDAVSIAYGIRNVQYPERCFAEVRRILKPKGMFGILELTRPSSRLLRIGHALYLKTLLPVLGKWIAKDESAYQYLSQSIGSFSSPEHLMHLLSACGFQHVEKRPLMGGIATLLLAS